MAHIIPSWSDNSGTCTHRHTRACVHTHTLFWRPFPILMWWSLAGNSHFPECSHLFSGILPHPWFIANKSQKGERNRKRETEQERKSTGEGRGDSSINPEMVRRRWESRDEGKPDVWCVLVKFEFFVRGWVCFEVVMSHQRRQQQWHRRRKNTISVSALFQEYWSNSK